MNSLEKLEGAVSHASRRTGNLVSRHPRTLTSVVVIGLAGFAAAAFGTAAIGPDAADLPKHMVTQSVTASDVAKQLEALAEHELELYRSDLTRSSDTPDSLLRRMNVDDAAAAAFLRADPVARKVLAGRSGKMVQVRTGAAGELQELIVRFAAENPAQFATHFTRIRVARFGDRFRSRVETAALAAQVRMGSGTIRQSLFAATDEARLPDVIASQIADIFSTDVDFHRELRRGDTFSVVYEALTADGEPITWNQASGRVLAAEFINNGKKFTAVWFKDATAPGSTLAKGAYFDINGKSKRHSFLASPMEFSRVTSGFAMRFHPIMQKWRQHDGVDYGAPAGTPVRSVGDGVVDFAGWQNGYGNVVSVRHSEDRTTVYAHLSRIDVRKGQQVEQGAVIAAVGSTGWATGPHLHFEFKVKGVHQDPLIIAKSAETLAIGPEAQQRFAELATGVRAQLDAAGTVARTSGSAYAE